MPLDMHILLAREMTGIFCACFSKVDFISSSIGQGLQRSRSFQKLHRFSGETDAFSVLNWLSGYLLRSGFRNKWGGGWSPLLITRHMALLFFANCMLWVAEDALPWRFFNLCIKPMNLASRLAAQWQSITFGPHHNPYRKASERGRVALHSNFINHWNKIYFSDAGSACKHWWPWVGEV